MEINLCLRNLPMSSIHLVLLLVLGLSCLLSIVTMFFTQSGARTEYSWEQGVAEMVQPLISSVMPTVEGGRTG